jgi:cell division septation protein DedD
MAKASEDTEITLGTGKLLALFFGLVSLCAVFFALGFSFGRNSVLKISPTEAVAQTAPAPSVLRPSALKTSTPAETSSDTSAKDSDTPAKQDSAASPNTPASSDAKPAPPDPAVAPSQGSYFVQVAAVSKQEDAEALVEALKKKQYPAFASNGASDKLIHVQVGPYGDVKEAEAMRTKLTGDGYNPILKK